MLNIILESLGDLFGGFLSSRYERVELEEMSIGAYNWETTYATVCDIKTAHQYKSNGKIKEGYIHIYKVEGRSKLYKDAKLFNRPKFEIGETVRGYTKQENNNVDSPKMGLFFLNYPTEKFIER